VSIATPLRRQAEGPRTASCDTNDEGEPESGSAVAPSELTGGAPARYVEGQSFRVKFRDAAEASGDEHANGCTRASQAADSAPSRTRRDLNAMLGDGAAYSVMVGIGENYLPAFALAMGMGQVVAGLIACVPLLAGAVLQLISPYGVSKLGSYRRWVSLCAAVQAASFLPLVAAAWFERIPVAALFLIAGLYWGGGMSAGPAWSAWATAIVPARLRSRFFACRTRISQAGVLVGFVGGGVALQYGSTWGRPLEAFALIFAVAAVCRFVSSRLLALHSEPLSPGNPGGPGQVIGRREIVARLKHNGEGRLLIYLWMTYAAAQIAGPFFTPFILGHLRFDYATYMLILATSILTKALSMPLFGRFAHRYGARRLMIAGGLMLIPLPLFWLFSNSVPYLLCVQVVAGFAWAAFELSIILMSFDCIPASHRTSMLTAYNLGYALASVGGSLVGGLLLRLGGESYVAYLVVFAVSSLGRLLTIPLLRRLPHKIADCQPDDQAAAAEGRDTSLAAALSGTSRSPTEQPAVAP
jgi:MFS family permease